MKKKSYYGHLSKLKQGERVGLANVSVKVYPSAKRIIIDCNEQYEELMWQFKEPIEMLSRRIWEETKATQLFTMGFSLRENGIAFEFHTEHHLSDKIQVTLREVAIEVSKQIDNDLKRLA